MKKKLLHRLMEFNPCGACLCKQQREKERKTFWTEIYGLVFYSKHAYNIQNHTSYNPSETYSVDDTNQIFSIEAIKFENWCTPSTDLHTIIRDGDQSAVENKYNWWRC